MKSHSPVNSLYERVVSQIPSEVATTLTEIQLNALQKACLQLAWKKHGVDVRLSIPLIGRSYYLVLLSGRERRSQPRIQAHFSEPRYSSGTLISAAISGVLFGVILSVGLLPTIRFTLASFSDTGFHPTSIPWLQTEAECLKTERVWQDGVCWDQEHNPNF